MNKKIIFIFLLILILCGFGLNVFAQEERGRQLEVDYPIVQGESPETTNILVPNYVRYIYNALIWLSGIVALVVLIFAGFQYFTSAGSVEQIRQAKEKITAALLGLVILMGSYLILWTINPDLISISLPRLRPIISELSAGVWACKKYTTTDSGEDAILRTWDVLMEYKFQEPDENREREIKKELDILLNKIALNCYHVATSEDIRPDYDNKIQYVYFIPNIQVNESVTEYGAVIYEERGFKGATETLGQNLVNPQGSADAYLQSTTIGVSSIRPFALIYKPDPSWEVVLYQSYNENKDIEGLNPMYANITTNPICQESRNREESSEWWCRFILPFSPKSMEIKGDLLVILCKEERSTESCHVFFSESVNNLEYYDNIINWRICRSYEEGQRTQSNTATGPMGGGATITKCAEVAATNMIIISASPL